MRDYEMFRKVYIDDLDPETIEQEYPGRLPSIKKDKEGRYILIPEGLDCSYC